MTDTSSATQTWTEHFGISEQLFQQWRIVGGTTPFLSWCLQNGAIKEELYMQWACARYQLPLVKDSFFQLSTVDDNWHTGKFLYQWTEDLLPLEEWDGVVRIACTEPPAKFNLERPHLFVLASPSQLHALWHRFFPQAPVAVIAPAVLTPIEPIVAPDFSSVLATVPASDDAFDPAAMMAAFNQHADAAEAAESSDAVDLNPAADQAEAFVMPEGFVMADPNLHIPMPTFGAPKATAVPEGIVEMPAAFTENTATNFGAAPILFSDELTPPPDGLMAATPPAVPPIEMMSLPETPASMPPPIAGEYAPPVLPSAPSDFDLCDSIEEVVSCAFMKMKAHFQYQMALLPSGETLSPWLWSGKFVREIPAERPHSIDLVTPSFFRIVTRTSMPYHGHTRPSDVNDKFFKDWTQGAAPSHVTVVPVIIDSNVAILLFGGMDNVIDARAALSEMEQMARSAALACRRISEKSSGAAA